MGEVHRLPAPQVSFSLQTAGRLMTKIFPQWVQDLALLVESVETVRPPGALPDWQPGAIVRLPYSRKLCRDGAAVCTQALMALADTAMVLACSAAWNGYRPMTPIDQTTHFPAAGELRCHRRCARGWAEMLASAVSCCLMPPTAGRSAWWQALTGCCEGANTRSK